MSGRVVPFQAPAVDETLPHSIETEQSLLGAILQNNDALALVTPIVGPEHFAAPEHAAIFQQMAALVGAGLTANAITLKPYLGDGDLGGMTVSRYLSLLQAEAITVSGAPGYAQIIRSLATRRDLIRTAKRMDERARFGGAEVTADEIIDEVEADLLDARTDSVQTHLAGMSASAAGAWLVDRIEKMQAGDLPVEFISTGLPDLDRVTNGGYGRGQLWIIAGRPGVGKTVVFTGLSRAAARNDGVLALQFEVTRDQQIARYLSDLCYVHDRPLPFGKILKAVDLDEADMWRVRQAAERFGRLHLRVEVQPGATLAQISFLIRAEKKRLSKTGVRLGVVFIDYLKFIKASDRYKGQRFNEVGEITAALKTLAKAEDVCIILLAQLNRGVEAKDREDRRPGLADLGVSGDLEQDADVVCFLYRESYYLDKKVRANPHDAELSGRLIEKLHDLEFILGKNRAGPQTTIDLFTDIGASHIAAARREFY